MSLLQAYGGLVVLLALASGFDWHQRRIPNWLSLTILVTGLVFAYSIGGLPGLGLAGLHVLIVLLGGLALYALRVVGAGDAKLYAATAAWFSVWDGVRLLACIALAGLAVLMVWAISRRLMGKRVVRAGDDPKDMLPYGVAISLGAVFTALMNLQLL